MPIINPRLRFIEKFLSCFSRLWRDPVNTGKDIGLCHSWPGRLLTGLNRMAAYPRFSMSHHRPSVNASRLSLRSSSLILPSYSQRTKISLLPYTISNRNASRKNSKINKVLHLILKKARDAPSIKVNLSRLPGPNYNFLAQNPLSCLLLQD